MLTKKMNLDVKDNILKDTLKSIYAIEEIGVIYATNDYATINKVLDVLTNAGIECVPSELKEVCKTVIADEYVKEISTAIKVEDKIIIQKVVERKYEKFYEEHKFFKKIKALAFKGSEKILYISFILYEVLISEGTPPSIKTSIISGLGYFICPIDLIPDMIVGVGLSDDLGALMVSIKLCEAYITDEIKEKAKSKVSTIIKTDTVVE